MLLEIQLSGGTFIRPRIGLLILLALNDESHFTLISALYVIHDVVLASNNQIQVLSSSMHNSQPYSFRLSHFYQLRVWFLAR